MHGHCPPPSVLERTSKHGHLSFSFSLEREPSKLVSKIRWLSSSQKHKGCLAGWLVVRKGTSSTDAHIGIYYHKCAHLHDCCMDLLLLLLHCFSSIASISHCHQNTKLFCHNLFSSSLVPTQNLRH
jgi:hypothetical protein